MPANPNSGRWVMTPTNSLCCSKEQEIEAVIPAKSNRKESRPHDADLYMAFDRMLHRETETFSARIFAFR